MISLDDVTDFSGNSFNGWQPRLPEFAPNGAPNWQFVTINGKTVLKFPTQPDVDNSGNVLTKNFQDLDVDHLYSFTVHVKRMNAVNPAPSISLRVGKLIDESFDDIIVYDNWIPTIAGSILSGSFKPQHTQYYFKIFNSTPETLGNDFLISRIQVSEHNISVGSLK